MLNRITKYVVRKIHGHQRSPDGYLLTRRFYMDAEQELALGQSYLGLAGFPIFMVVLAYLLSAYGYPGGGKGDAYGVSYASFSKMPGEVQILLPIAIIAHLIGMASTIRLAINWSAISGQDRTLIEN